MHLRDQFSLISFAWLNNCYEYCLLQKCNVIKNHETKNIELIFRLQKFSLAHPVRSEIMQYLFELLLQLYLLRLLMCIIF